MFTNHSINCFSTSTPTIYGNIISAGFYSDQNGQYPNAWSHARHELNFSFPNGHVKFQDFKHEYNLFDSTHWRGRKIKAIPAALFDLVKFITHTALSILLLAKCPFIGDNRNSTAYAYTAMRDLEECGGHLTMLIDDLCGSYWAQRADFYKACYQAYLQDCPN